jgi:hypothetical protein
LGLPVSAFRVAKMSGVHYHARSWKEITSSYSEDGIGAGLKWELDLLGRGRAGNWFQSDTSWWKGPSHPGTSSASTWPDQLHE